MSDPMNFFSKLIRKPRDGDMQSLGQGPEATDQNPMSNSKIERAAVSEPSKYYDETLITLTHGSPSDDLWLRGYINHSLGYKFSVKVFDLGSPFGINDGRISKLSIQNSLGETVVQYERGWSIYPKSEEAKFVLEIILKAFAPFTDSLPEK